MIGNWSLGRVSTQTFIACLEHLREIGHERVVLFMEIGGGFTAHNMYWLVCTDPDGDWYWVNDPEDTGWHHPVKLSVEDLPGLENNKLTLFVSS